MNRKIYLRELQCYINADDKMRNHELFCSNRCFNLTMIKSDNLASQIKSFIFNRGEKLSPLSIRADLYPCNMLCNFLADCFPELQSFSDISEEEILKKAKLWLMTNGKPLFEERKKTGARKKSVSPSELLRYIKKLYKFLYPATEEFCFDEDRWFLKGLPFSVKDNPIRSTKSISFKSIPQDQIRTEVKEVIYIHLSVVALGTVLAEMTAINRFTKFLAEYYPEITSLNDVTRSILERYLIYVNTVANSRKSYSKDLCHLRSVMITAGKVLENPDLENLFFADDIGKTPDVLYRVYSDSELKRLNAAITEVDEQVARALFMHQLLGTRISGTLTLKQDALFVDENGKWFIRINQVKSGKSYTKPINEDIRDLFGAACEYTNRKYGNREFVFVREDAPDSPMQYGRIQYQIMAMVEKYDLRDDNGEPFGVGTHIWRHCYGKRLTELHVDDVTIAKLMGHSNTSSLKNYRKIGNQVMADETRETRDYLNSLLSDILSEWD